MKCMKFFVPLSMFASMAFATGSDSRVLTINGAPWTAAHKTPSFKIMSAATNGTNIINIHSTPWTPTNSTQSAGVMDMGASIGTPAVGGSGCPANRVSAALSPDGSALSVLFDDYTVTADGSNLVDYKDCNMAIPVHVPYGYSVSFARVDYRGFNFLPYGTEAELSIEYFFAGSSTVPYIQHFRHDASGDASGNFLLQDTIDSTNVTWSRCGTSDVTLRINNSLKVTTNVLGEQASSTIDTIDVSLDNPEGRKGLVFYLQWNPCGQYSAAAPSAAPLGVLIPLVGLAAAAYLGL
jgi:hypothetical protein